MRRRGARWRLTLAATSSNTSTRRGNTKSRSSWSSRHIFTPTFSVISSWPPRPARRSASGERQTRFAARALHDGERISLGQVTLEILETPRHMPIVQHRCLRHPATRSRTACSPATRSSSVMSGDRTCCHRWGQRPKSSRTCSITRSRQAPDASCRPACSQVTAPVQRAGRTSPPTCHRPSASNAF